MHNLKSSTVAVRMLLLAAALWSASCGYHVRSSVGRLPGGMQSLGIPAFRNLTNEFKLEQTLASALLREFSARTRSRVDASSSGVDLVLMGEILSMDSVPVTFRTQSVGEQTFGSTFQVTVRIRVKLLRLSDSAALWENDNFIFRERYVLTTSVRDFFSEENPALDRLARNFAASLASAILDRSAP